MTSVVALFGAYAAESLRIGVEFDRELGSGEDNPDRQLLAVYADLHIGELSGLEVKAFGRLESYDPNLAAERDGELNIIAGVNVLPIKTFNIAPNIRYRLPQDGDSGTTAASGWNPSLVKGADFSWNYRINRLADNILRGALE